MRTVCAHFVNPEGRGSVGAIFFGRRGGKPATGQEHNGRAVTTTVRAAHGPDQRTWRVSHPSKDPTVDAMDDFATLFEAEEHAEMLCELIKLRSDVYAADDWQQVFVSEIH
jgi:hypothetical protein